MDDLRYLTCILFYIYSRYIFLISIIDKLLVLLFFLFILIYNLYRICVYSQLIDSVVILATLWLNYIPKVSISGHREANNMFMSKATIFLISNGFLIILFIFYNL